MDGRHYRVPEQFTYTNGIQERDPRHRIKLDFQFMANKICKMIWESNSTSNSSNLDYPKQLKFEYSVLQYFLFEDAKVPKELTADLEDLDNFMDQNNEKVVRLL